MADKEIEEVVVLASDEAVRRLEDVVRNGGRPDRTITAVKLMGRGFSVSWETESAGFGHLSFYKGEDGDLRVDTEAMGYDFALGVLVELLDSAYGERRPPKPESCFGRADSGLLPGSSGPTLPGAGLVVHLKTNGAWTWCAEHGKTDPSEAAGHVARWPDEEWVPTFPNSWCPSCAAMFRRIRGRDLPVPVNASRPCAP